MDIEKLQREYDEILDKQQFNVDDLDYSIVERHKTMLTMVAQVSNSGITVFDMYLRQHVFTSYNFTDLFGYDLGAIEAQGNDYFNEHIHPDDMRALIANGNSVLRLLFQDKLEVLDYKMVNEYRIRNRYGQYVRVIEQQRPLEFDKRGNIWLTLSVLDLSPDQTPLSSVKSKLFNIKTGEHFSLDEFTTDPDPSANDKINLTRREIEILKMVKQGLLSKEISRQLSISIHTVNTHRQKILEKMQVDNSMEAVNYAKTLGLLG